MARTRRRYRSRFKRRRVSRRGLVRKRARRYRFSKKRSFRRRIGGRRRRTGVRRYGRRKYGRGTFFKSPASNSRVKFLRLKTDIRPTENNVYAAPIQGNPPDILEQHFYTAKNTVGLLGSTHLDFLIEKPDVFPPNRHSGLFFVFSLDTYIRAMCGSFFGFRNNRTVNTLAPTYYGAKGLMSESELSLRRHFLEHTRSNLYKIGVRFIRRVGRSIPNSTVISGFATQHLVTVGTQTQETFVCNSGGPPDGTAPILTVPDTTNLVYVPNTAGDLPFYSQNVEYLTSPWQLYQRIRAGFPTAGNDQITGVTYEAGSARLARLFTEMVSGREWRKQSGIKSLHFSLGKKKRTGDFLRVEYGPTSVMDSLKVGVPSSTIGADSSYGVAGELGNFPRCSNSFETHCATIQETAVYSGGSSSNVCTLPAVDGPRGSVVIWIPYDISTLNALYDIEIYGKYRFSNGSSSSLDLPLYAGDTSAAML